MATAKQVKWVGLVLESWGAWEREGGGIGLDLDGPEVVDAPGHVGFYAGHDGEYVRVLGGNQNDGVNVSAYARDRVLGVRRLRG